MGLASGSRLGAYEIQSLLGEGGMGQVYLARDTRLQRDVAIKVLSESFAGDPDRLMRFEREAQTLASLNHPNIAHIHGVEESPPEATGAVRALVMEFVPGESLDARLARGPVARDEALGIARQLIDALDAAHSAGIVHRDFKPANIRMTPDGIVKVLDFGLARIGSGSGSAGESGRADLSSTITSPAMTAAGVILGTAAYMSPEQARGRIVDKRADIWAFGAVLYELLTGRRAFEGEDVSDLLVAVLSKDADFAALPPTTPRSIRQLLRRCLERDPKHRLRDIGDARVAFDEAGQKDADEATATAISSRGPSRTLMLGWLAVTLATAAGAAWLGYRSAASPIDGLDAPQRLTIQLAGTQDLITSLNSLIAFSPDGTALVFSAREGGKHMLFRRELGAPQATAIPGTDGAQAAFFSPDGRWIGFVSDEQLKKVPVEGGRPFPLGEARGAGGATWLRDGTLVYTPLYTEGLFRVPADGGTPERLTTPDHAGGELGHFWPDVLPGERFVTFTAFRTPIDRSRIGILDLSTRRVHWAVDGGFYGRYVSTGHLIYAKEHRLYAQPFDLERGATAGPAVAVIDDLFVSQTAGFAGVAVSSRGTLAYVRGSVGHPLHQLVWLDRTGTAAPASSERRRFSSVALSPDGRQAALTILDESRDLWIYSFDRGTLSRLTRSQATEFDPRWSRDGSELFFVFDRPPFELHRVSIAGQQESRPLWKETVAADTYNATVSPDGRTVAFVRTEGGTGTNIYARAIDGSIPPRAVRATQSEEGYPTFSPDGRFVAFQANDTGRFEIYVQSFPDPVEHVQVSADGGTEPVGRPTARSSSGRTIRFESSEPKCKAASRSTRRERCSRSRLTWATTSHARSMSRAMARVSSR